MWSPWASLPGGPLVHVIWGPVNSELAIIDAAGRVLIANFSGNLNRPTVTRVWDGDSVDDAQAIVGTYWLQNLQPTKSRVILLHFHSYFQSDQPTIC